MHDDPSELLVEIPTRIRKRIVRNPDTGCWEWTGCTNNGYGYVSVGDEMQYLHRFVWQIIRKRPAALLHHKCVNRLCCNPDHLEPLSNKTEHSKRHKPHNGLYCKSGRHIMDESRMVKSDGKTRCRLCYLETMQRWRRQHRAQIAAYKREQRKARQA